MTTQLLADQHLTTAVNKLLGKSVSITSTQEDGCYTLDCEDPTLLTDEESSELLAYIQDETDSCFGSMAELRLNVKVEMNNFILTGKVGYYFQTEEDGEVEQDFSNFLGWENVCSSVPINI